ncbi:hypothetical protein GCM10022419_116330 [Nonomuraea rosea]|uniref:Uncharacterized protein n=1 Tax=Nonomuraea rosea TaxID=638574 RepID=A0ABP6ZKT9_9ACTN
MLVAAVMAERAGDSPEGRVMAVARGYVRFAAKHRVLFESLFGTLPPSGSRRRSGPSSP